MLLAGPIVGWIVGALEGAVVVGGLSAIGAGLYSLGIPKDSVLRYETALKSGKFVLIAHGTKEDIDETHRLIENTHPEAFEEHQPASARDKASLVPA